MKNDEMPTKNGTTPIKNILRAFGEKERQKI